MVTAKLAEKTDRITSMLDRPLMAMFTTCMGFSSSVLNYRQIL